MKIATFPCTAVCRKFLWETDVLRSSDEFENGCIPVHCGMSV